ncbi:putative aminophospholipid-translocase [Puttea exsequens]|nr:putative aminophospholipid-translocase [Puttea exsequens]
MARDHQYHQPNAPDSPGGGSDSDMELDLQELDPATTRLGDISHGGESVRREVTDTHIPLRNLRIGRARGFSRYKHGLKVSGEDEDMQGLLEERSDHRESTGSTVAAADDAPLLHPEGRQSSGVYENNGRPGYLTQHLRLPGFASGQTNPGSVHPDNAQTRQDGALSRNISIGQYPPPRFPPNAISNAKYSAWSFLPRTLYNEFSFFLNMYFLLVALSQIIPSLRIGYLSTYVAPLAFVLAVTLGKEALDDLARRRRDAEANNEEYTMLRIYDKRATLTGKRKGRRSGRLQPKKSQSRGIPQLSRLEDIVEEEEDLGRIGGDANYNIEVDEINVKSRDLKVGDVVRLGKDQRVPADLVILKSFAADTSITPASAQALDVGPSYDVEEDLIGRDREFLQKAPVNDAASRDLGTIEASPPADEGSGAGETFIRTDQLDGETDWKLRLASPLTQTLDPRDFIQIKIVAGKPSMEVNDFVGTVEYSPRSVTGKESKARNFTDPSFQTAPLTIDNTAWANTVLASNATVLAVVVYTGAQTRQALSTSPSRSKVGLLEREINNLTKILCALTLTLSIILVAVRGIEGRPGQEWYVAVMRFLILFSTIVPISLRVNLDMGKTVYARFIEKDKDIPGTLVRTSTIPEELGRIEYLLSDKTGTLTQNEMDLKKVHVGTVSYANEAMDEVRSYVRQGFSLGTPPDALEPASLITPSSNYLSGSAGAATTRTRREIGSRVRDLVLALALCHNVTPSTEVQNGEVTTTYQASSPDEIAIVQWAEAVGLRLLHRDRHTITLQSVDTSRVVVRVKILEIFPFTSTGKRMGIILQFFQGAESTISSENCPEETWFFEKGADTVMTSIVAANDWLEEETANMAREGLRTLVVGRKKLSADQYQEFSTRYKAASISLHNRDASMARVIKDLLEHNLELLGVTGVEDKLQKDVKSSLELLRNAGIKIWMLTGDKVETARCVAVSAKLVSRTQYIHTIKQLSSTSSPSAAHDALSVVRSRPESTALLIDGTSLSYLLAYHRSDFISLAVLLPAVIACRCSPTQKADVANLIRQHTGKRVLCIGDGGNDVSMIQAADVGVGIVGKEGRQASLAADFSVTTFHHLTKLLVWHGRNSYKRSAKLAQFVIHRGLIISVCQTFYSIATQLQPHALYRDWLLVGYATVYTMAPVFSLVLDKDVDEGLANLYPELYKELRTGKSLSYRTFFVWVAVSIYQGGIIQGLSQILVDLDSDSMVSVSFTVLVINELIMVAFEITTWHWIMAASIVGTMAVYVGSVPLLGGYFNLGYVWSWGFAWRVATISAISLLPPYCIKILSRTLKPPSYRKVQGL